MESTRKKRRRWGSVIVRRDPDGNPTSFQARYVNPLDPSKTGHTELRAGIQDRGVQVARRRALPHHPPSQRHQAMDSPVATKRRHHAHVQRILQGLFRQLPHVDSRTGLRMRIRAVMLRYPSPAAISPSPISAATVTAAPVEANGLAR